MQVELTRVFIESKNMPMINGKLPMIWFIVSDDLFTYDIFIYVDSRKIG